MLLLACAWLALGAVSLVIGAWFVPIDAMRRPVDRALLATWIGLTLLAVLALATALVLPVSPWTFGALTVAMIAASLHSVRTRECVRGLAAGVTSGRIAALTLLFCALAVIGAQRKSWGDVGLYHAQAIRWFADYGVVPGLGLIHNRLGTGSSWLALAALFDHGPLRGRADAVLGGMVLLLACLHIVVVARRVLRGRSSLADRFALVAWILLLPYLSGKVAASPTPDAAVAALATVTAWAFLAFSAGSDRAAARDASAPMASHLLPLLLGAGAVTMKLSAIPILAAALLFLAFSKLRIREAATAVVILICVIAPLLAANTILSGCPLYPAEVACADLPWTVKSVSSRSYAEVIQTSSRWYGEAPDDASIVMMIRNVLSPGRGLVSMAAVSLFCLLIGTGSRAERRSAAFRSVFALFAIGTGFVLWLAPLSRFLIGYVVVVPALFIAARVRLHRAPAAPPRTRRKRTDDVFTTAFTAVLALVLLVRYPAVNVVTALREGSLRTVIQLDRVRGIAPESLPSHPPVTEHWVNDVRYTVPVTKGRCWAADPPCTPYLTRDDIRLRSPRRGHAAGFELSDARAGAARDSLRLP